MKTVTTTKLEITDQDLHAVSTLFNHDRGERQSHAAAREEILSEVKRLMQESFYLGRGLLSND